MARKTAGIGADRNLSSIEMTVLGLAWLRGPCTTYAIMKELSMSASTYHKSRAGTAYSVSKRLLENGFLERLDPADGTHDGDVRVSELGIQALQSWLTEPLPMADIAHSADLIRLRFFFLGVVDQGARLAFIDRAIEGLRIFLAQCEDLLPKNEDLGDYFGVLATMSTIFETRARIQWLELVREFVKNPIPEGTPWAETVLAKSLEELGVGST